MVNTVPFRTQMRGEQPLSDWLQSLRAQQVAIRPYEHTPLREVQQWSEVRSGNSLFETILAFDNHSLGAALRNLGGNWLNRSVELIEQPPYPLTVAVHADPEMKIRLFYSRDRFADAAIADLGNRFQRLLDAIPENAGCLVRELPLMSEAERAEVLGAWNATTTAYPRDASVAAVFEAQVAAAPEAVAVSFEGAQLRYDALNARANQLAHELRARGVGPDVRVGLCVERSLEMVVGLLGILKAGGAYVPLDPTYPAERLAFMVEDTQVRLVLTQARFRARFSGTVLCLDADAAVLAEQSVANPAPLVGPEHLAYLIYTSGSTGRPKAVAVPQRAVVRLVKGTTYVELGAQEVLLQFAPLAFDASTFEIWGALLNGGRLVVCPPDTLSLEDLGRVVREQGVTTLWLTAGLFHQMIETAGESLRGLKQLLAGGDVLSAAHVRQALRKLPGCRLINGYGPTENTTFTCCHSFGSAEEVGASVPIGRPIANTRVYVLDGVGAPVPVGVAGELYIGGDGLARGYWARPALTAERFVASALDPGGRLYRTGDLVRWRPDGVLEFLGRRDGQVKIRGFRVEVGEIEAILSEHAAVQQVAVAARDADAGGKRLVAYVVGPGATAAALREYMRERVPDYMVPSLFVFLAQLPLTANGKVDRAALPAPETMTVTGTRKLARTPLEQQLAIIWAAVLGVDDPDIHTSFFDLGGHSLLATQVISRIAATVNVELPIRRLFESPTIAGLAEAVAARRDCGVSALASPIVPVSRLPHGARRDTELRKNPQSLQ
jgi:amino acid adenylation domain-containing protein